MLPSARQLTLLFPAAIYITLSSTPSTPFYYTFKTFWDMNIYCHTFVTKQIPVKKFNAACRNKYFHSNITYTCDASIPESRWKTAQHKDDWFRQNTSDAWLVQDKVNQSWHHYFLTTPTIVLLYVLVKTRPRSRPLPQDDAGVKTLS